MPCPRWPSCRALPHRGIPSLPRRKSGSPPTQSFSLLENRTWTGGRFGSMHPCLPPTASSLPTEPYLNLRAASRNSMICLTWSAVGLHPSFRRKALATSESVIGTVPLGSMKESMYCTASTSCVAQQTNARALGGKTTLFMMRSSSRRTLIVFRTACKASPGYPFNRTHPGLQFSRGGSLEGDPGSAGARAPRAAWATPPGAAWWR